MSEMATGWIGGDEAERAELPGMSNRLLLGAERTGGRFAVVEHRLAPRALGAPVHTHANEDEVSYVVEGRLGAIVGDEEIEAGPGDLVVKPRGVPHAFWNAADVETRVLETITPGGFERYFVEAAPLLTATAGPDFPRLAALQAGYEMTMDPSSIGPLVERLGLRL